MSTKDRMRGIRQPIPAGTVLARIGTGKGPPVPVKIAQLLSASGAGGAFVTARQTDNTINGITVTASPTPTDQQVLTFSLASGTFIYQTINANAQDAVAGILADSAEIAWTYVSHASISASLKNNSILVARLHAAASPILFGRSTVGAGAGEEITIGTGLSLTGGVLANTGGPPTGPAGGVLNGTYPNPGFAPGPTFVGPLNAAISVNGEAIIKITNVNAGSAANASFYASNGTSVYQDGIFGTGYATFGPFRANGAFVLGNGAGGLSLITQAAQPIYFAINSVQKMQLDATALTMAVPILLPLYTVAGLAGLGGTRGMTAFVTDATVGISAGLGLAPIGGGGNEVPVFYGNGGWKIG